MSENKKYDFSVTLHLPFADVKDAKLSETMAKALVIADSKDKSEILKFNEWITDLNKDGSIQLSGSDKSKLEEFMIKSNYLNAFAKGKLIEILSK